MAQIFIPRWLLTWITIKVANEFYHFHYSYRTDDELLPSDAQLLTYATNIFNFAAPGLQPILNSACQILSCTVRCMTSEAGHEATYTPPSTVLGTGSGDREPGSIAGVISLIPGIVGKGVRGRMFVSGISDTGISSELIVSSLVAALTTLASAYRSYAGDFGHSLTPVIASRKHVDLRPILASTVSNQVNNQIRRLPGHRRHKRHTGGD